MHKYIIVFLILFTFSNMQAGTIFSRDKQSHQTNCGVAYLIKVIQNGRYVYGIRAQYPHPWTDEQEKLFVPLTRQQYDLLCAKLKR